MAASVSTPPRGRLDPGQVERLLRRPFTQNCIAQADELPSMLESNVLGQPISGLLISAGATLIVANAFDLTSIATLGSTGFLLIFAAVNVTNARHAPQTGSREWISATGAAACFAALAALI